MSDSSCKIAVIPAKAGIQCLSTLGLRLDDGADAGVDEAWRIEVERRVAEIDRGEVQLVPGDEVFARLRRKLG